MAFVLDKVLFHIRTYVHYNEFFFFFKPKYERVA